MVVNNVCCLIFIIVLCSSPIIKNVCIPLVAMEGWVCFWKFSISASFGSHEVKNVDERGRNLMCVCTLPSLLVEIHAPIEIILAISFDKNSSRKPWINRPKQRLNLLDFFKFPCSILLFVVSSYFRGGIFPCFGINR